MEGRARRRAKGYSWTRDCTLITKDEAMTEVAPIVRQLAAKYMGRGLPREDLMQSGYEGALVAYRKFDPTRGVKFTTYAYYWVEKYLQRAVNNEGREIRIPQAVHDYKITPVERAARELEQELGRDPTAVEIAERTGLEVMETQDILDLSRQVVISLDSDEAALIPSPEPGPEELTEDAMRRGAIMEALDLLSTIHKEVTMLRMGIYDGRSWSLGEVAGRMNVSRQRVQQIERDALEALRRHPTARRLLSGWRT